MSKCQQDSKNMNIVISGGLDFVLNCSEQISKTSDPINTRPQGYKTFHAQLINTEIAKIN